MFLRCGGWLWPRGEATIENGKWQKSCHKNMWTKGRIGLDYSAPCGGYRQIGPNDSRNRYMGLCGGIKQTLPSRRIHSQSVIFPSESYHAEHLPVNLPVILCRTNVPGEKIPPGKISFWITLPPLLCGGLRGQHREPLRHNRAGHRVEHNPLLLGANQARLRWGERLI